MLIDEYFKNLPDYYDTMYLDGYAPEQIMEVQHRSMRKRREAEQQRRREEAATEKVVQAHIEKAVSKALDDIFKGWKRR